jgi:hypothetical protein
MVGEQLATFFYSPPQSATDKTGTDNKEGTYKTSSDNKEGTDNTSSDNKAGKEGTDKSSCHCLWSCCKSSTDDKVPRRLLDSKMLAKDPPYSGRFEDILIGSTVDEVKRYTRRAVAVFYVWVFLVNLLITVPAVINQVRTISVSHSIPVGLTVEAILLHFVGFLFLYPHVVCIVCTVVISFTLLGNQLHRHADTAALRVIRFLENPAERNQWTLDRILRARYRLSQKLKAVSTFLEKALLPTLVIGSAFVIGSIFTLLSLTAVNPSLYLIPIIFSAVILVLLSFGAWLTTRADELCDIMITIRTRFPSKWSAGEFHRIRGDLDSIIAHCQVNRIGFEVAGLLVTPSFVKALAYAVLSAISVIVQQKALQ